MLRPQISVLMCEVFKSEYELGIVKGNGSFFTVEAFAYAIIVYAVPQISSISRPQLVTLT